MKLITLAALIATAATLQGCEFGKHSSTEALFTALGAPLPAGLGDDPASVAAAPVTKTPENEQVVTDVLTPPVTPVPEPVVVPAVVPPPPPPLQYGDPGYVAAYMQKGYTGPEPCPGSVFRVLTCDDDGVSWHWLGSQMEWLD